jgi:hypothetical protein
MSSLDWDQESENAGWSEMYNSLERQLTGEVAYRQDLEAKLEDRVQRCKALKRNLTAFSSHHDRQLAEGNDIISGMLQSWKAAIMEWQEGAATQNQECSSLEVKLALSSSHCNELAASNLEWYSEYQKLRARHATSQDEVICAQTSAAVAAGAASSQCEMLEREAIAMAMRHAEVEMRLASTEVKHQVCSQKLASSATLSSSLQAQLAEAIADAAAASLAQHATLERLAGAEAESERLRKILWDVRATPPPPPRL